MAELSGQPADGGSAARPSAALLSHRAHSRSVAARAAGLRSTIMDDGGGQEEYIRQVLEAYRKTPGRWAPSARRFAIRLQNLANVFFLAAAVVHDRAPQPCGS